MSLPPPVPSYYQPRPTQTAWLAPLAIFGVLSVMLTILLVNVNLSYAISFLIVIGAATPWIIMIQLAQIIHILSERRQ